jgi:hypothetical protein
MARFDPTLSGSDSRFGGSDHGGNSMTRDWLLTLLVVMAPFLLAATIVVVTVIRNLIQNERIRRAAETSVTLRRSGSEKGSARKSAMTVDLNEVHSGPRPRNGSRRQ